MAKWAQTRSVVFVLKILALVVIASFVLSGWTVVRQSTDRALREADHRAANAVQVNQCYAQVRNAPSLIKVLGLLDILATNSIKGNRQALSVIRPDDPLRTVRENSLIRLLPARQAVRSYIALTRKQTPKIAACHSLAVDLNVDDSKLRNERR